MNTAQGAIVGGDAEEVYVSIGIVSFVPEGSLPTWLSCPGHLHTCDFSRLQIRSLGKWPLLLHLGNGSDLGLGMP